MMSLAFRVLYLIICAICLSHEINLRSNLWSVSSCIISRWSGQLSLYDRCCFGARTSRRTHVTRSFRTRRSRRTVVCAARRRACAKCVSWSSRRYSARCFRVCSGRSGASCSAASLASASATQSTAPTAFAPTRPLASARCSFSRAGGRDATATHSHVFVSLWQLSLYCIRTAYSTSIIFSSYCSQLALITQIYLFWLLLLIPLFA